MNRHQQHGRERLVAHKVHVRRGGHAVVVEPDTRAQTADFLVRHAVGHLHQVLLAHLAAGVEEVVHQVAVVGQQQQTLAVVVQPPDRVQAHRVIAELVHHRRAAFGVGDGRHLAHRLVVRQIVLFFLNFANLAIHRHHVGGFIHLHAHFGDNLPVYRHMPVGNQLFGVAARRHAGEGKKLLETHHSQ